MIVTVKRAGGRTTITASMDGLKNFGLRTSRKIKLFNGKLESRLVYYPIFERPNRVLTQDSSHS